LETKDEFLSLMENNPSDKWYFKNTSLVIGFLVVGPFILPLVWANPHFSNRKKIIISIIIIILSCLLLVMAVGSFKTLFDSCQQMNNLNF